MGFIVQEVSFLEPEAMFLLFKPLNVVLIVRTYRCHQIPVLFRVIHMYQVADFMCDHVVDDAIGCQHN